MIDIAEQKQAAEAKWRALSELKQEAWGLYLQAGKASTAAFNALMQLYDPTWKPTTIKEKESSHESDA